MSVEIKNLKKAAKRILKAVKNKEKIILYGDADMDGVASVIILEESIRNLGGEICAVYFPDREKEGYGLNITALNYLKSNAPALLILLDCGISNFEESKLARRMGFEVIIVDHHEILDKLPEAAIIVDPKQKGDKSPFKILATAGIAFKLSQELFGSTGSPQDGEKFSENLRQNFLELTALATISDMMPQELDNRIFIDEGLSSLERTFRPGLQVFWEINSDGNYGGAKEISSKIISALNVGDNKEHLTKAYLVLTSSDKEEARVLAQNLLSKSLHKQTRIKEITEGVLEKISKQLPESIVFEGDERWEVNLLGSVASRICHKQQKPIFIYKKGEKESIGATRTPSGVNGVEAMKTCGEYLKTFGGHPLAAGFTVKNENLEKFKRCLIEYFECE